MRRIDWDGLVGEAIDAMRRAYCPYSRFPVGAAGLVDDGRVVSGCNVENAAYGATLCAECGMVSDLIRSGGGTLVAVAVVDGHGQILAPCGRCRQLIVEHAAPSCLVRMPQGPVEAGWLLPGAFGPRNLDGGAGGENEARGGALEAPRPRRD